MRARHRTKDRQRIYPLVVFFFRECFFKTGDVSNASILEKKNGASALRGLLDFSGPICMTHHHCPATTGKISGLGVFRLSPCA